MSHADITSTVVEYPFGQARYLQLTLPTHSLTHYTLCPRTHMPTTANHLNCVHRLENAADDDHNHRRRRHHCHANTENAIVV